MDQYIKQIIRKALSGLSGLLGPKKTALLIYKIVYHMAVKRPAKESLIFLLELENHLYSLTGLESCRYGNGIHTKHRHTGYHKFFKRNISSGETVLDIGCGNGELAYELADCGAMVTAIDSDINRIQFAQKHFIHENIKWICGIAPDDLPSKQYDVIVLSNILEHIEDRINFLKKIRNNHKPKKYLIRVPLYTRDWRVPLMRELGVDYRLDHTHYIEYTREIFEEELNKSALRPVYIEVCWGEIWCRAEDC